MNMHVRSPETGNATIPAALLKQERDRQKALKKLARLRKEARDQIERLLAFLDASDTYVTSELEDDGDQNDASYPTSGSHVANPMEDDECSDAAEEDDAGEDNHDREDDRADFEPSLGWTTDGVIGNCSETGCDVEMQNHLPVAPQGRTTIPGASAVMVDNSYRRFLHGLTPEQTAALKARMSDGNRVVLR